VTTTREELYTVLVSLANDTLLLPNVAVQEVVGADRIQGPPKNAPAWYAGRVAHQNLMVPIVRFEVLNGGAAPEDGRRTRLAIIHALTDKLRTGLYAIICQGYPHLVTLNRAAMKVESVNARDRPNLVLARVGIANTSALIPNLETIELHLAQVEGAG
jgi:chemosensory pili system protein ChpC